MPYSLRETIAAFRRAPLLVMLSAMAIGLSLFVAGLFGLTAHNLQQALVRVEERVEVVAYLKDDVAQADVEAAQAGLRALPEVAAVQYVSKDDALAAAMRDLPDFQDVFRDLDSNPLPASLEVRLRAGFRTSAEVEAIAQRLRAHTFVDDVRFGREWVDKIVSIRRIIAGGVSIIGGAFAAVAAIVIATAVRIAVAARREEISIMRLVGATTGFIQRPFLLEGLITGLLGGGIAAGLTYAAYRVIDQSLYQIEWLPSWWLVAGIAIGATFGFLSSVVAVRRHLRAV
ncbi:ABC transporter permease [soil metagenome]|jgi:cell division transport system permease protein|nr:permease-like cell division protein FtsX [Gemmatimonadota bacterium]